MPKSNRFCYTLLPSQLADPKADPVNVIKVTEHEPGYHPEGHPWTRAAALKFCAAENAKRKLTQADVDAIIASSMFHGRYQKEQILRREWAAKFKPLIGRTIVGLHWLGVDECNAVGISKSPLALTLDDGTLFWPMADDEGNEGGALFFQTPAGKKGYIPEAAPTL